MRSSAGIVGKVWLFVVLLSISALAENQWAAEPAPAVAGPAYDISLGYSNLMMAVPGASHLNLSGLEGTGSIFLSSRWGVMVESNYLRTSQMLGTTHPGYVLSSHAGPVFYPAGHGDTRLFIRGLAGAGLVDGAVPVSRTEYAHGWLVRPSYVGGAGVERFVSRRVGIRVGGDYVRTVFYDSNLAARPQNNIRITAGFVFELRER